MMFWDRESETLPRPALEQQQLRLLQETVRRVAAQVPFYGKRLAELKVDADAIKSLDDVRRLPFTTGADLRAIYPAGLLVPGSEGPVRLPYRTDVYVTNDRRP